MESILILSPHVDDGIICAGATISRFLNESKTIYYISFSLGGYKNFLEKLAREFYQSLKEIGLPKKNSILLDFKARYFKTCRQKILDKIWDLKKEFQPDVIFCPSSCDLHQDHQTIYEETVRAFKGDDSSLLGFDFPYNSLNSKHSVFFEVRKKDLEAKWRSLSKYTSQLKRPYMNRDFIFSLAKVRGLQSGCDYAEAFEPIKIVYKR